LKKIIEPKDLIFNIKNKVNNLNYYWFKKIKTYNSKSKKRLDPVTILDIKIEKLIRSLIRKYFPNHSVIGEEFGDKLIKNSNYTWIIDPIDGTKNLILGLPTWSNLIGLYKGKNSILSFANFPMLEKFYLGYDKKTIIFDKKLKPKKIFSNKKIKKISDAKIAINTLNTIKNKKIFNFLKKFKGIYKITNVDAYNSCLLAEGKIDILIESGLKKVDIMPLVSIVENSGAIISDWKGNKNFNSGKILVSANKELHKKFLKIIN